MIPELVIDQVTQAQYTIQRDNNGRPIELGRGATAVVYRAKLQSGSTNQPEIADVVAIKVAYPNLLASTLEDFRAEQKKLAQLREKTRYVPWAHPGQDPQHPDLEIIILELVQEEWRISKIASQAGGRLPEALALEVGCQYAQLLAAMHHLGLTLRGDRKEGDIHWDAQTQRLVVLDWNRAQLLPEDKKERETSIRQDIRIFGRLWAQSMLGRVVETLEPDDVSDEHWCQLTFGTRLIFAQALGCSEGEYAEAEQLKKDLDQHWQDFQDAQTKPATLLTRARNLAKQMSSASTTHERIAHARDVRRLGDLVYRSEASIQEQKQEASDLGQQALRFVQDERTQVVRITETLQSDLLLQQYEQAKKSAQEALARFQGNKHEELLARLTLRRWYIAASIAVAGKERRIAMQPAIRILSTYLPKLQSLSIPLSDLQQAQREIRAQIPDQVLDTAQPLLLELAIRMNLAEAQQAEEEKRSEDARVASERALQQWKELRQIDKDYANELEVQFVQLHQMIVDDAARQSFQWLTDSRAFIEKANRIFDAILQVQAIESIQPMIEEGLRFYEERLAGREELRSPRIKADEEEVRQSIVGGTGEMGDLGLVQEISHWSKEMQGAPEQRNEHLILQRLYNLQVRPEQGQVKEALIRRTTQSALEHIQYLMKEGRWPDELELGKDLQNAVLKWGKSEKDDVLIQAKAYFSTWEQGFKNIRKQLLELWRTQEPVQEQDDDYLWRQMFAKLRDDLDDSRFDDLLRQAEEFNQGKGIELFERRGLSEHDINQRRVTVLRRTREARHLKQQLDTLVNSLNELTQNLSQQQQDLANQFQQIQAAYTQTQQAVENYRRAIVQQESLERQLEKSKEIIGEFNNVADRLKQLEKELPQYEQIAKDIQEKMGGWQNLDQATQEAVGRVKEAVEKLTQLPDIEKAREEARTALPKLDEIIQAIYITAGLTALRQLRLEDAKKMLQNLTPSPSANPKYTLLDEAIQWLERNQAAEEQLTAWQRGLGEAEKDPSKLATVTQARLEPPLPPAVAWLVGELYERHAALRHQWLAQQAPQSAESALTIERWVEQATEALQKCPEDGGTELERIIQKWSDSFKQRAPELFERELFAAWTRRLSEAQRIAKELKKQGQLVSKAVSQKLVQENLVNILDTSSDEVFAVFEKRWTRVLEQIQGDQIEDLKQRAKDKAERGRTILSVKTEVTHG